MLTVVNNFKIFHKPNARHTSQYELLKRYYNYYYNYNYNYNNYYYNIIIIKVIKNLGTIFIHCGDCEGDLCENFIAKIKNGRAHTLPYHFLKPIK